MRIKLNAIIPSILKLSAQKKLWTSTFDYFFKSSNLLFFCLRKLPYLLTNVWFIWSAWGSNFEFSFCHFLFFDWSISVHMFLFMTLFQNSISNTKFKNYAPSDKMNYTIKTFTSKYLQALVSQYYNKEFAKDWLHIHSL